MTDFFKYPNVVGHGLGYRIKDGKLTEELATIVLVDEKLPEVMLGPGDRIPGSVDGIRPIDVLEVGIIRAHQRRSRLRPAPGGVSIGHYAITAGTLGVVVRDASGQRMILSNNHVLANSNGASKGDAILQPGPADGGTLNDQIATLERWIQIAFEGGCLPFRPGPNLVDAALAIPLDGADVLDEILDIGLVQGTRLALLGQAVRKSGRTTGLTTGTIQVLDAAVKVSYGSSGTAKFEGQIITTAMSQGGDSGSLLVDGDELAAVGLLFAGSDQITIHNPINDVLSLLGVIL